MYGCTRAKLGGRGAGAVVWSVVDVGVREVSCYRCTSPICSLRAQACANMAPSEVSTARLCLSQLRLYVAA